MSGIILFLNAGDPGFDVLARVVLALDEAGVDWLELAVPFPDSVTDGPTIRRSARRALDAGADLDATLAVMFRRREKAPEDCAARRLALHGAQPGAGRLPRPRAWRLRRPPAARRPAARTPRYYERAHALGVPLVTTAYAGSSPETLEDAARNATAYLYLASGPRTGDGDPARMAPVIATLRPQRAYRSRSASASRPPPTCARCLAAGADAAIVGSSFVAALENAADPVAAARAFVAALALT